MSYDDDKNPDGISELIRCVKQGQETIFDLLGENGDSVKTIAVKRRQLQPELPLPLPEAPIARAAARNHVFNDIDAFSEYLNRWADPGTSIILADTTSRTITAVLDEANETDRETVTLKAIEHPLFTPWAGLLGRAIPVMEFALFVMQNRRAVVQPNGRELAFIFSQVKMSKAITMNQGVGKKSLNGVMVEVEIAGERKGQPVELPEMIVIEVPIFVGTSPQAIEIDLLVTPLGDNVVVYATAADVQQQRIAAFEEMVAKIKEQTGQLVGLGQVSHRAWSTLTMAR